MAGTGLAAAPTLALMAIAAVLWPQAAEGVVAQGSALLLLLVAAHLLVGLAGLPFLGLGGLAVLGAILAGWLGGPAGTWPALVLSGVAGGLLLALATPLLAGWGGQSVAGASLGFTAAVALVPWPAAGPTAGVPPVPAAAALALAVAGLVLGDRLGRSTAGLAVAAAGQGAAEPLVPGPEGLQLLPAAVAGLAAATAGAMLALSDPPAGRTLPSSALAISLGTFAAAGLAGRRGAGGVLLAGLPLLVAPSLAPAIWPEAADLRLVVPAAALLGFLILRALGRRAA